MVSKVIRQCSVAGRKRLSKPTQNRRSRKWRGEAEGRAIRELARLNPLLSRKVIVNQGSPDAGNLVYTDRGTHPAAADGDVAVWSASTIALLR
jgi:hypothetical protein